MNHQQKMELIEKTADKVVNGFKGKRITQTKRFELENLVFDHLPDEIFPRIPSGQIGDEVSHYVGAAINRRNGKRVSHYIGLGIKRKKGAYA